MINNVLKAYNNYSLASEQRNICGMKENKKRCVNYFFLSSCNKQNDKILFTKMSRKCLFIAFLFVAVFYYQYQLFVSHNTSTKQQFTVIILYAIE